MKGQESSRTGIAPLILPASRSLASRGAQAWLRLEPKSSVAVSQPLGTLRGLSADMCEAGRRVPRAEGRATGRMRTLAVRASSNSVALPP